MSPAKPSSDRTMAIGCFADIVDGIGGAARPHFESLAQIAVAGLSDSSDEIKRNACYLLGVLGTYCTDAIQQRLQHFLSLLHPLVIGRGQFEDVLVDNACSAALKIVSTPGCPTSVRIHVADGVVSALPIVVDHEEDAPVYDYLGSILLADSPNVAVLIPSIFATFVRVLACNSECQDAVKQRMISKVSDFIQRCGNSLPSELLATLEQSEVEWLQQNFKK